MTRRVTKVQGGRAWTVGTAALLLTAWPHAGCDEVCGEDERWIDGACRSRPSACGEAAPECTAADQCCPFPDTCWSLCPSGDAGCPCWDDSHCQGLCLNRDPSGRCEEKTEGTCSDHTSDRECGCACVIRAGEGSQWCWD